jgi:outer membrane protein
LCIATFKQEPYFMRSLQLSLGAVATGLALATSAQAQQAGDTILSLGAARLAPKVTLGALNSVGPASATFNAVTSGATASSNSVDTVSFSVLQMFTHHWAAELSLGIPPTMTLDARLGSTDYPGIAKADVLTPTLVAKYLFNTPADKWRPYVGLGVSYASFNNVQANTANATVNALAGGSTSLSSSWAPVYNLGVIYNLTDRLFINASVSYIPVKTDVTFVSADLATTTSGRLELNPTDYVIRLGYKF